MHYFFEATWIEEIIDLSRKAIKLIEILNNYSIEGEVAWELKTGKYPQSRLEINRLEQSILSGEGFKLHRTIEWISGVRTERVWANPAWLRDSADEIVRVDIEDIKIEADKARDLFKELVLLFEMPYFHHIPGYHGFHESKDMKNILEAALQRDNGAGAFDSRCHQKQIALAKSLAAVLPRIGFEYYPPNSRLPLLPQRLGWLNCWSNEVAEHLGFPDPQKDADLLPLCSQLPSGHWIVQLTEDPLDLTRPDHVEAIVQAYWRFDKIGRRAKPAVKKKATAKSKPAPVDPASLRTYVIHASDSSGNWWEADYPPIEASSEDEALRIYFCKLSRSRMPRPHETLGRLRKAYDAVVLEVEGLPRSEDVEARLKE